MAKNKSERIKGNNHNIRDYYSHLVAWALLIGVVICWREIHECYCDILPTSITSRIADLNYIIPIIILTGMQKNLCQNG